MTKVKEDMRRGIPNLIGKDVIGIDESNNEHKINGINGDNNGRIGRGLPMIVIGCLVRDYPGKVKNNLQGKGGVFTAFGGKTNNQVVELAREYASNFPNFYYSRITEQEVKKRDIILLQTFSTASIILNFFNEYDLREENTYVCIDRLWKTEYIEFMDNTLKGILDSCDLFREDYYRHIFLQNNADKYNVACKASDRLGYGILGMRFRTRKSKWPYRNRIKDFHKLPDFMIDRLEMSKQEDF